MAMLGASDSGTGEQTRPGERGWDVCVHGVLPVAPSPRRPTPPGVQIKPWYFSTIPASVGSRCIVSTSSPSLAGAYQISACSFSFATCIQPQPVAPILVYAKQVPADAAPNSPPCSRRSVLCNCSSFTTLGS